MFLNELVSPLLVGTRTSLLIDQLPQQVRYTALPLTTSNPVCLSVAIVFVLPVCVAAVATERGLLCTIERCLVLGCTRANR